MKKMLLLWSVFTGIISCDYTDYERGNGDIISEKRMVENFAEIHLTGNYEIGLKKGPKAQVVIVTDSNLLPFIETEVHNQVLLVESNKKLQSKEGIKIYVTFQQIEGIKSIGASTIKSESPIISERFELEIPGAGLVDLEVDVRDLEVLLAGAGSVKLKGQAENQTVSLKGIGNLEAYELESQTCDVTVAGMGGAEVNVKENLRARVNGVGSIKYRGNPMVVDDKVSGIGTIQSSDSIETDEGVESI